MTTHEKLVLARNTLAKRGKATKTYMDGEGHVCVYGALLCGQGALDRAAMIPMIGPERSKENLDFANALGFTEIVDDFTELGQLFLWNDRSTLEQVLERLDKAIAATAPMPEEVELEAPELAKV